VVTVALYAVVCAVWGTTWLAIKYAVDDVSPLLAAGTRFLVAAPLLIALCAARRIPMRFPAGLRWLAIFVAVGYFCVPYLLLNVGERYISSGLTAIGFSTVSVLIVVMSVPVLGVRPRRAQWVAILIAFAALAAFVAHNQAVALGSRWAFAAILGAAAMHSFAYVVIKRYGETVHVLTLNTVPMAAAGLALTALGVATGGLRHSHLTERGVLAVGYLGVVASVGGFLAYFWLLKRLSPATLSFVFVVFPIVAQLISSGIEGSRIDATSQLLVAVILAAFAATHLAPRRSQRRSSRRSPCGVRTEDWPTPDQLRQIYDATARAYPGEGCGYLRRGGVYECDNALERLVAVGDVAGFRSTATGYALGLDALRALADAVDDPVDPVVLIYHSHPDVGAYFSEEDQRFAVIDGRAAFPVDHLVVDVRAGWALGAVRFSFDAGRAKYLRSRVYGSPRMPDDGVNPPRRHSRSASQSRRSGPDE
jgi:drug/metabolite transporter (DMT)-like permease/proteasome lid subunit RPN8/RPN11